LLSANISNHIFLLLLLLLLLSIRAPGGHVKTKGTIYLSNIRMVFVASKPVGNFFAFDMPLVSNAILKVGSLFLLSVLYNLNKMQGQKHRTKKDRKKVQWHQHR
jgi:hypothetical protein